MALDGTGWHRMAQDGTGWHWMALDGTGWHMVIVTACDKMVTEDR